MNTENVIGRASTDFHHHCYHLLFPSLSVHSANGARPRTTSEPPRRLAMTRLKLFAGEVRDVVVRVIGETIQFNVVVLANEELVKEASQFAERRSLVGIRVPAVVHYVVHLSLAVLRLFKAVAIADASHHLGSRQSRVWCGAWQKAKCGTPLGHSISKVLALHN